MPLKRGHRRTAKSRAARASRRSSNDAKAPSQDTVVPATNKKRKTVFETPCNPRVLHTKSTGPIHRHHSPLFSFVSPQKINSTKTGARGAPLLDSGQKLMLTVECLRECLGGDVSMERVESKPQEPFSVMDWVKTRRPSNPPARFKSEEPSTPKSATPKLKCKHRACFGMKRCMKMMAAFFTGKNQRQCACDCHLMGEEPFSHVVFNDFVGKRLHRFVIALWRITQRLTVLRSASLHLEAGLWDGKGPLKMTAAHDTRWQKARGWNSLHGTSYAIDHMSGMPIFVCCLHRAPPACIKEGGPDGDLKHGDQPATADINWQNSAYEKELVDLSAKVTMHVCVCVHACVCACVCVCV